MGIKERKERERERRRQQIIVAAKRVFTERGFSRATMENIAKEAELSSGTLYLYFNSKEELYASLSLRILQHLSIRVEQVDGEEDPDPLVKLDKLIEAMYDLYEFDPINIIKIFHLQSSKILKNLSPQLMMEITMLSNISMDTIANIFEGGIKKGVYINRRSIALADIFWSLFSGVVLWEASKKDIGGNKDNLKRTLEIAFEIFRNGIIVKKWKMIFWSHAYTFITAKNSEPVKRGVHTHNYPVYIQESDPSKDGSEIFSLLMALVNGPISKLRSFALGTLNDLIAQEISPY